MTSAHKTSSNPYFKSGLSLLEVVVALFLMGLLMTFGLVAFNGTDNDKELRKAVIEFETLSSRARSLSFLTQSPHRISICGPRTIKLEEPFGKNGSGKYVARDTFTSKASISLRRWGAKDADWLEYDQKNEEPNVYWYFSPTGLCEPVSVRLLDGNSWVVLHMDPLTGRIQEEESLIQ